ncbi:MAG: tRNA (adenosine(37)-N6)-threonylcarbamoyltransferase complex ATPase subunit type 1 TsaE [Candidatus Omnitrophica bacterium]|nr:tRNA (adenosine(37)-N6)-threonylcarbamoyltransferase complex ATPase subunit type 1 TsaE [Candidatus Omnitrophota bacterium]
MKSLSITTYTPDQTQMLGECLAAQCKGGEIICLSGNLGSGKTTLVKGMARGLKIDENKVNSPTFVIMNVYEGRVSLYHFDFYRLEDPKEIGGIGYDEFLYGNGIAVIEWSERFGSLMPPEYLAIDLSDEGEQKRILKFTAHGKRYQDLMGALQK